MTTAVRKIPIKIESDSEDELDNLTEIVIPFSSATSTEIFDQAPEPGPLIESGTTCKANLNVNLNLQMIANHLQIDSQITGKKMVGVVHQGMQKTEKKDFSNQCTIVINGINLKIFANSVIMITGARTLEE